MRLGLSSAAAPNATLDELLAACVRRGLAALELREGDAHGLDHADVIRGAAAAERTLLQGVSITAWRAGPQQDGDLRRARLTEALDATLLLEAVPDLAHCFERAAELASVGARVGVVLHGDESDADLALLDEARVEIAWDADPARVPLAERAMRIHDRFGMRLRHVNIVAGGPEAVMNEGRGVGELMGRLALAGYDGSIVLSPSSTRYRVAWETWLGTRGGWGCGSAGKSKSTVVALGGEPATAGIER